MRYRDFRLLFARKANQSRAKFTGDKARDRGDWPTAASNYRHHLLLWPADFDIWVQYGHALKESGRLDDSASAYERAREIDSKNGDPWLSLGHVRKLKGDVQGAIDCYRQAVIVDGNSHAGAELSALGVALPASESTATRAERGKLLRSFGDWSTNLKAINASDLALDSKGNVKLLSEDPWIEFEIEGLDVASSRIGILTVQAEPASGKTPLAGQIYVDLGNGYFEWQSVHFSSERPASILAIDPAKILKLRWDPDNKRGALKAPKIEFRLAADIDEVEDILRANTENPDMLDAILHLLRIWFSSDAAEDAKKLALPPLLYSGAEFSHDYNFWRLRNEAVTASDYRTIDRLTDDLATKPTFSFVMPTYNTPVSLLRECIDSMLAQTYSHFEICIADDNSPDREVWRTLKAYAKSDPRVKIVRRKANGHISAASNSALSMATGDFVVLMDHDDLIPDYALFVVAWYINQNPGADIFYSDEDKIDVSGRRWAPYFKSDFNKFLMFGHNLVSHLGVYRRSLVETIGGFRLGLEGSQDYDLLLRAFELCGERGIVHIPHVLYHWRAIPGSTAMSADQKGYAVVAAQEAINGHFERTGTPLRSVKGFAPGCTGLKPARVPDTLVSIIIPTRNGLNLLRPCLKSIFARPRGASEIIIIDNGSDDPATLAYLDRLERRGTVQVLRYPHEFNFSLINNFAVEHARGEIVCFLNNDTEVLSSDWLDRARGFLAIDEIGMVGSRLLYPDGTLQHFGIVVGMGNHGIAGVPHLGFDGPVPGYFGKARLAQQVSAVTAACLFMRKADFEAVGGFQPELQVAYNDIDLSLKIRNRGLKILVDPDILLLHKESKTRGSDKDDIRAIRLSREADWMRTRWAEELSYDPYYSPNLSLERGDFAYASPARVPFPWQMEPAQGAQIRWAESLA